VCTIGLRGVLYTQLAVASINLRVRFRVRVGEADGAASGAGGLFT